MNIKSGLPERCPSCDYPLDWTETGVDLICHNINCNAKTGRNLLHFFQVIDNLDGLGPKTIETMIEFGYDTITAIYSMTYNDLIYCGFGPKQSFNIGSELELSKERPIEDWKFIAALGIPHLGIGNSKTLCKEFNYEDILLRPNSYIDIDLDGFGEKMCDEILTNLYNRKYEIISILELGFNITEDNNIQESPITGMNIVFTGKMKNNRKEMSKHAETLGAKVQGGVNKNTAFLVIGDKVGANKINAAKKFATQILTEDEYYDLIK